MIIKKCLVCSKKFKVHNYRKDAKYCSSKCYQEIWEPPLNRKTFKKGKRSSPSTEFKKGHFEPKGEKSRNWKGDKVTYSGIHQWIRRNLGLPEICEFCGKNGLRGKKIHWANKDHQYRRNLNDYIRLCISCHQKYDFKMGFRKK